MIANTHRALRALVVLLLFASFAWGVAQAGPRYTAEFKKGKTQIVTIALLPPEASMVTLKVGQDDAMVAEAAQLEDIASAITRVRFKQAGYEFHTLTHETIEADPQLRDLARRAYLRFETEYAKLRDKPRHLEKRRYGIGEAGMVLADYLDVDAVAFQKVEAEGAAGGQVAMALFVGGSMGHARIDLTIVNGANGDFEAFFTGTTNGVKASKLKEHPNAVMKKAAKLAFTRVPEAPETSRRAAAVDEQTVLAELEGLLTEGEGQSFDW